MTEPRIETRKQMGTATVLVNGEYKTIPIELTIIDTYWPDGRKDVTVRVPRLEADSKTGVEHG